MMPDEKSSTYSNPLGISLRALREKRDRLFAFVLKKNSTNQQPLQQEEQIGKSRENWRRDETASPDFMNENMIPVGMESENQINLKLSIEKQLDSINQERSAENINFPNQLDTLQKNLEAERSEKKIWQERFSELSRNSSALEDLIRTLNSKIERLEQECAKVQNEKSEVENQNQALTIQNQELSRKNFVAENSTAQLRVENYKLESRYHALINKGTKSAFAIKDMQLVHALSSHVVEQFSTPFEVVRIGEGPYNEGEFDDYLRKVSVIAYERGYPWIIVGREGWTKEQIDELIENSDSDEVRVFSQELFVAGILTTHDPFSLPVEILMKFAEGHPALEYLIDSGFEWPEINLEEDYGEPSFHMGCVGGVEESPLTAIGYRVGVTRGLAEKDRRKLLAMAYTEKIPPVGDDAYMKEWGHPNHSKRLWRIAHHIKREAEKRKSIDSMRHACRDWKSDSEWLKKQFYTKRMRFKWPDV